MTKVKKLAVVFALVGAIAALVGIFLPWINYHPGSLQGWNVFTESVMGSQFENFGGSSLQTDTHALIVVIASIFMLLCSLAAFVLVLKSKVDNRWIIAFGIMISLAAMASIGGLGWFLTDISSMDKWSDHIGYGVYVCGGGAILGLISGVLVAVKKK